MQTQEQKHSTIFNKNFYPTPTEVLDLMGIDCTGLNVLEPSAGSGNILKYCAEQMANELLYCEINHDLAEVCKSKGKFLKHNFLDVTAEEISHIQMIVMNPPFDDDAKHILHAWKIAPDGCEIISLCNSETIRKSNWGGSRKELEHVIDDYGYYTHLGDCFSNAERKTDVEVTCVKLFKPMYEDNEFMTGFYMDEEPESNNTEGIISYNEIQAYVNSYIGAIRCFDEFEVINNKMISCTNIFGCSTAFKYDMSYNKHIYTKGDFAKYLQKRCWNIIFHKMGIEKYVTSGIMKDINKFVEMQTKVPFTVKNIYRMFDIIFGTRQQTLDRALIEIVDKFTKHTHENRYGVPGWKTNEGHLLNKKIIIAYGAKPYGYSNTSKLTLDLGYYSNEIEDLVKVLCNITGQKYEEMQPLRNFCDNFNGLERGQWYSWHFFNVKMFKKGTIHLEFVNSKDWELINRKYGELKGFALPEKL